MRSPRVCTDTPASSISHRSERLSETDVQRGRTLRLAGNFLAPHLESEVDSNGLEGRAVADPEPDCTTQLAQLEIRRVLKHVAGIHEPHHAEAAANRNTQLGVEDHERISADRQTGFVVDRIARLRWVVTDAEPIERKAADRRIASRVKALARRQIAN